MNRTKDTPKEKDELDSERTTREGRNEQKELSEGWGSTRRRLRFGVRAFQERFGASTMHARVLSHRQGSMRSVIICIMIVT